MRLLVSGLFLILGSQFAFADSYEASCWLSKNGGQPLINVSLPLAHHDGIYDAGEDVDLGNHYFKVYVRLDRTGEGSKPAIEVFLSELYAGKSKWSAQSYVETELMKGARFSVLHNDSNDQFAFVCILK